ncbi:Uncharacterized protein TCM_030241 [Theobroma cacao]|uniref:Uncharacterized protein n=1 Tax=Theobroma cacao TaxID=3641 RepID=A0A061GHW0_THECC|nr:Uncharacterized protein TCM_030241 [Theobroma cacao]
MTGEPIRIGGVPLLMDGDGTGGYIETMGKLVGFLVPVSQKPGSHNSLMEVNDLREKGRKIKLCAMENMAMVFGFGLEDCLFGFVGPRPVVTDCISQHASKPTRVNKKTKGKAKSAVAVLSYSNYLRSTEEDTEEWSMINAAELNSR